MCKNILLVDDHQVFSSSLKLMLEASDFEVKNVSNVNEALKYLKAIAFDLIITDIEMPTINGIDFVKELHKKPNDLKNEPKILVLSSHKKNSLFKQLYDLGINGYLSKNVSSFELVNAIKKVLNNETYYDNDIYNSFLMSDSSKEIELTKREKDVLQLILNEKTTTEIAYILNISPHTVEGHRKNLLQKTNSKNVVGLIKYTLMNNLFDTP